jgi:cell division transport system permease protein
MTAFEYSLREGTASLRRSPGSNAFAVAAIALATLVLGALLLVTSNIERLLVQWADAAEFSVFLRDDATSEQRGTLEQMIDQSGVALERQYVSKGDALRRFRQEFAELSSLAAALDGNPFPASVEVRIRPEAERDARVQTLVAQLAAVDGVVDVRYDREWIARATAGLSSVRRVGFTLAAIMMVAAGLTVATVVRLALHARRDEIEVMQLVGSPYSFIRGPFIAEGLILGGLGAVLSLLLLWLVFSIALGWWGSALTALVDPASIGFLPAGLSAFVVGGGMAVGSVGGYAAARAAK